MNEAKITKEKLIQKGTNYHFSDIVDFVNSVTMTAHQFWMDTVFTKNSTTGFVTGELVTPRGETKYSYHQSEEGWDITDISIGTN